MSTKAWAIQCGPDDIPYYPIRLVEEQQLLRRYIELATSETGVSFIGRLGTYRYLDMDVTIAEAMHAAEAALQCMSSGQPIPVFFNEPI